MTPYRQDHKPESSGMLLRNIEARIVNENGEDVAEGQPGELIVRCASLVFGDYSFRYAFVYTQRYSRYVSLFFLFLLAQRAECDEVSDFFSCFYQGSKGWLTNRKRNAEGISGDQRRRGTRLRTDGFIQAISSYVMRMDFCQSTIFCLFPSRKGREKIPRRLTMRVSYFIFKLHRG